ncbi:unnamed protein product [Calicophoron daubneyi]
MPKSPYREDKQSSHRVISTSHSPHVKESSDHSHRDQIKKSDERRSSESKSKHHVSGSKEWRSTPPKEEKPMKDDKSSKSPAPKTPENSKSSSTVKSSLHTPSRDSESHCVTAISDSDPATTKSAVTPKRTGSVATSNTPKSEGRKSFWAYQSREGPRALGSKPIPKGNPTCLKGKTFLITGILESIEREDAQSLIERCGGKVMKTLGKKTEYLVVGREPGESKLSKAETLGTKQLDEDQFFSLIRKLSNESLQSEDTDLAATADTSVSSPTKVKKPKLSPSKSTPVKRSAHESPKSTLTAKPVVNRSASTGQQQQQQPTKVDFSKRRVQAPSNQLWVEKYKPTSRRALIGQAGANSPANRLYNWLSTWHQNLASGAKAHAYSSAPPWATGSGDDGKWARAALLSGPPGIGKTSTAAVICAELGFSTCELNASDCRSKRSLQEEVSHSLGMQNLALMAGGGANKLSTNRHVLLMDEVDGMAGNEDRGGMQELIGLIKSSKIPIICMCNDRQSTKVRSLANYCLDLRFHRPRVEQIKAAILSIACKEGVTIPSTVLTDIIAASNNDIRQIINNTQMWCSSGLADETQLASDASAAYKDLRLSAFEVIRKVFSPDISGPRGGAATINDSLDLFFQDYSLVPLFVQENYLNVRPRAAEGNMTKVLEMMAQAADDIAMGDIVSGAIRSAGAGSWSLLPVQGMFGVVRPGRILRGSLPGGGPGGGIAFPSWFGKNSTQGRLGRIASDLAHHLCLATHGCSSNSRNLILDYASVLADSLTRPLKEGDVDRVLQTLISYQLEREDLDSILELATWPNRPNRMAGIDSKVKAALTRAFNKSVHKLPYVSASNVKAGRSKRAAPVDAILEDMDGDAEGLFDVAEDSPKDDEDMQIDSMIIKKKASKTDNSQPPVKKPKLEKSSTSKSSGSSESTGRGRGRGGRRKKE